MWIEGTYSFTTILIEIFHLFNHRKMLQYLKLNVAITKIFDKNFLIGNSVVRLLRDLQECTQFVVSKNTSFYLFEREAVRLPRLQGIRTTDVQHPLYF